MAPHLHRNGYKIHKKQVTITEKQCKHFDNYVKKNGKTIFNKKKIGKGNDYKRKQCNVKRGKIINPVIDKFKNILCKYHNKLNINKMFILHSKKDCEEQQKHTDYEPDELFINGNKEDIPLSAILALEDNTPIVV